MKFIYTAVLVIVLAVFTVLTMAAVAEQSPRYGLRIDSCKGECDRSRKDLGEWHTDLIPIPEGEECSMRAAVDEAIRWLEQNRPGFSWAGSGCIIYKGQNI